ncbi:hypothetical protein [Microvirga sp. KLBC 81]|uniref:terminase small subunit-like protein n=1 Tax=Microvirga sp. KLBC 81 TaxID=1862707 RepID=UPI00140333DC|nr:hypothetical protein [Microvirga sp. KLBC 81]
MTDKRPVGRPRVLTKVLKAEICARIANGETIRQITALSHMPTHTTLFKEVREDREFAAQYAQAREIQLERMEDELLEIADSPRYEPQQARVMIDTRKWIMAKRIPKKYGEKVEQTLKGDAEAPVQVETTYRYVVVRPEAKA